MTILEDIWERSINKKKKERSPGPAAYSLTNLSKSQDGWTFGMKNYDKFKIIDGPGPGTYNQKNKGVYVLGKFGKETRTDKST